MGQGWTRGRRLGSNRSRDRARSIKFRVLTTEDESVAETVAGPTTKATPAPTKRMRLRYSGLCRHCGVEVPAGVVAIYDKTAKNITCVRCADKDPETATTTPGLQVAVQPVPEPDVEPEPEPVADIEVGVGGASARREHERRKANDDRHIAEWEGRVRAKHPVLGGLVVLAHDVGDACVEA